MNKLFKQLTALHSPPIRKPYASVLAVAERGYVVSGQECKTRVEAEEAASRMRNRYPDCEIQIYIRGKKINA